MADLTIITVVKDDKDGFAKTQESVVKQTAQDFDWLVFEGGAATPYSGQRINHFYRGTDTGIYNAMNEAVKRATTPYILFLNAGDTLYSQDSLKRLLEAIKRSNGADFICGSYCFTDLEGRQNIQYLRQDPRIGWNMIAAGKFNNRYMHGVPLHNSTAIKRSLIVEYPYRQDLKVSADTEHMIRCWNMGYKNWAICPAVICNFFAGGASTTRRLTVLMDMVEIFRSWSAHPEACKEYLKTALPKEFEAQAKYGFKPAVLLRAFRALPLETAKLLISHYWRSVFQPVKPRTGRLNIVNLSLNVDFVREVYSKSVTAFSTDVRFYATPQTQHIVKAIADEAPVANLNSAAPLSGETVLIADNLNLTPGELNHLWLINIRTPLVYSNGRFERAKIKRQRVTGLLSNGEGVYALD